MYKILPFVHSLKLMFLLLLLLIPVLRLLLILILMFLMMLTNLDWVACRCLTLSFLSLLTEKLDCRNQGLLSELYNF